MQQSAVLQKALSESILLGIEHDEGHVDDDDDEDVTTTTTTTEGGGHNDPNACECALFIDLIALRKQIRSLQDAFASTSAPMTIMHTVAMKANPIAALLKEFLQLGLGVECASRVELAHALAIGFPPSRIVFDSPCKTRQELAMALEHRVYINADNLQEVDRIASILAKKKNSNSNSKDHQQQQQQQQQKIGLRINPQVGTGSIDATSTASMTSKFGVALLEHKDEIVAAYRRHAWLTGIHCHVGSQGCSIDMIVEGISRVVQLAVEINNLLGYQQIKTIDIGGSLSVNYDSDEVKPTFASYVQRLCAAVPLLFSSSSSGGGGGGGGGAAFEVITEFGRALIAKSGWFASRVEYTKDSGGHHIAILHAGADLFLRTAYVPDKWRHRISVFNPNGTPKKESPSADDNADDADAGVAPPQDIAGPLCFSGDLIARELHNLPLVEVGDWVVVHDAAAYTIGMWSRYNSRQAPPVWGYEYLDNDNDNDNDNNNSNSNESENDSSGGSSGSANSVRFTLLKKRESVSDVLAFWS